MDCTNWKTASLEDIRAYMKAKTPAGKALPDCVDKMVPAGMRRVAELAGGKFELWYKTLTYLRSVATTHTPGPWKSLPSRHGSNYKYVQVGADENYTTLEMLPADADLAAAAPDMQDALRGAMSMLFAYGAQETDEGMVAIRNALTKAAGQQESEVPDSYEGLTSFCSMGTHNHGNVEDDATLIDKAERAFALIKNAAMHPNIGALKALEEVIAVAEENGRTKGWLQAHRVMQAAEENGYHRGKAEISVAYPLLLEVAEGLMKYYGHGPNCETCCNGEHCAINTGLFAVLMEKDDEVLTFLETQKKVVP